MAQVAIGMRSFIRWCPMCDSATTGRQRPQQSCQWQGCLSRRRLQGEVGVAFCEADLKSQGGRAPSNPAIVVQLHRRVGTGSWVGRPSPQACRLQAAAKQLPVVVWWLVTGASCLAAWHETLRHWVGSVSCCCVALVGSVQQFSRCSGFLSVSVAVAVSPWLHQTRSPTAREW